MANYELKQVRGAKIPAPKKIKITFPKKKITKSGIKANYKKFVKEQPLPKEKITKIKIKAAPINSKTLKTYFSVLEDKSVAAAIDDKYNKKLDSFVGMSHSIITTLSYIKMRETYMSKLKTARTPAQKKAVQERWSEMIKAASVMNKVANGASLNEKSLDKMASALLKDKKIYNKAIQFASTAKKTETGTLSFRTNLNVQVVAIPVLVNGGDTDVVSTNTSICDNPIEGSITKHYSNSFSLDVRYTYWCPTWRHPFRTCRGTLTLAGVSFNIGIDIGYRVTCCGAIIWGNGYVNACGTIVGITACAGCSASVVAVAGTGRATSGMRGNCNYGLGANATVRCTVGGVTVFLATVYFGWTIAAPCPPDPLPC
jgi:hypothetical protein